MPLFHYEAQDRAGKKVIGTMQVADEAVLARRLQSMGYQPLLVQPAGGTRAAAPAPAAPPTAARQAPAPGQPSVGGVPARIVSQFYYELGMSLGAGISAFEALYDVSARTAHGGMRHVTAWMAEVTRHGGRLADGMACFPHVFSPAEVGLVRAGELGGFIVEALRELQGQMEADLEARRKLAGSWLYFWIVAATAVWVTIPISSVVRPAAANLDVRAGIPAIGHTLLTFSLPVTLAVVFGSLAFRWFVRTAAGRSLWSRIALRLPGLGALAVGRSRAVFAASLRFLYHGGVNPYDAWTAATEAVPNDVIRGRLAAQAERLRVGGKFSEALAAANVYPPTEVGLLATGERTGNIEEVLTRIADQYHQEATAALARAPVIAKLTLTVLGTAIATASVGVSLYNYFAGLIQGISAEG